VVEEQVTVAWVGVNLYTTITDGTVPDYRISPLVEILIEDAAEWLFVEYIYFHLYREMATERVSFELTLAEDGVPEPKVTGAHRDTLHTATAAVLALTASYVFRPIDPAGIMELVHQSVTITGRAGHALAMSVCLAVGAVGANVGVADIVLLLPTVLIKVHTLVALAMVFALAAVCVPFGKVGCLILPVALQADVAFAALWAFATATAPRYRDFPVGFSFGAAVAHYANTAVVRAAITGATEFFLP
jgi:hypothetical protein